MAENTTVGPGGSTSPANAPKAPDNHTTKTTKSSSPKGKSGPPASDVNPSPYSGPVRGVK